LPEIAIGDLLAIHDSGAHGWAMGFNYNGKLRSAELLLREDGTVCLIRRAETVEDYFRGAGRPGASMETDSPGNLLGAMKMILGLDLLYHIGVLFIRQVFHP